MPDQSGCSRHENAKRSALTAGLFSLESRAEAHDPRPRPSAAPPSRPPLFRYTSR